MIDALAGVVPEIAADSPAGVTIVLNRVKPKDAVLLPNSPQAAYGQCVKAFSELKPLFAQIEDDGGYVAGLAWAFCGEPPQVPEISPAHRRGSLDFHCGQAVGALRQDVDLAAPLVAPVIEAETMGLVRSRAQQFGKDKALQQPAESGRVGVGIEGARRQVAKRRRDVSLVS